MRGVVPGFNEASRFGGRGEVVNVYDEGVDGDDFCCVELWDTLECGGAWLKDVPPGATSLYES